jgi:type IV conjugative transfer system protein TraE
MKEQAHEGLVARLISRLGGWMVVGIALAISNVLLVGYVIVSKQPEKTIIMPAVTNKQFWVQGDAASPEYYEQVAQTFADLLLTYNTENAVGRFEEVLKHVNPSAGNELRKRLMSDLDDIRSKQRSSVYYITELKVKGKTVLLKGEKVDMMTGAVIGTTKRGYRLSFDYRNGRLFVKEFIEMPELAGGIDDYEKRMRMSAGSSEVAAAPEGEEAK